MVVVFPFARSIARPFVRAVVRSFVRETQPVRAAVFAKTGHCLETSWMLPHNQRSTHQRSAHAHTHAQPPSSLCKPTNLRAVRVHRGCRVTVVGRKEVPYSIQIDAGVVHRVGSLVLVVALLLRALRQRLENHLQSKLARQRAAAVSWCRPALCAAVATTIVVVLAVVKVGEFSRPCSVQHAAVVCGRGSVMVAIKHARMCTCRRRRRRRWHCRSNGVLLAGRRRCLRPTVVGIVSAVRRWHQRHRAVWVVIVKHVGLRAGIAKCAAVVTR